MLIIRKNAKKEKPMKTPFDARIAKLQAQCVALEKRIAERMGTLMKPRR